MAVSLGRVTAVYPKSHSCDVVLLKTGRPLSAVPVMGPMVTSNSGRLGLHAPGAPTKAYDPQMVEGANVFCYVDECDGTPVISGFKVPEIGQMTFDRPGFEVDRHPSDVYSTTSDTGDFEKAWPNGSFLSVATSPDHEDLTGQDFDQRFKVTRNTGAQLHLRAVLAGAGGGPALDLHVAPDGTATITLAGPATLKAQSLTVDAPTHFLQAVTGDATAAFAGDVTGQGTSLHTHTHVAVQPGSGRSGIPG